MLSFILQRVLATVPVMGVVALVVFLLLRLSPGDPAAVIAGDYATAEQIEKIRIHLGLDRPIHEPVRELAWSARRAGSRRFDLLQSAGHHPDRAAHRADPHAGADHDHVLDPRRRAARRPRRLEGGHLGRPAVMVFAVVGFSVPVFVLGYFLIYDFGSACAGFRCRAIAARSSIGAFLSHITLPTLALSAIYIALIARITRASVLEILDEDYIRTARAKGQTERKVLFRHALKNAAVPIVTIIGLGVALLIGGVVVTETVFNIPGLGRLVVDAILKRDYPIIQGLILFFSSVYILLNLLVDIAYTLLDPRIRY